MTKNKIFSPLKKIKPGILVGFILAIVLALSSCFLAWYLSGKPSLENFTPADSNIGSQQLADPAELNEKYVQQYRIILREYLGQAADESADLRQATVSAKEKLLNLTVPAPEKNRHLETILLLDQMSEILDRNQNISKESIINKLKVKLN